MAIGAGAVRLARATRYASYSLKGAAYEPRPFRHWGHLSARAVDALSPGRGAELQLDLNAVPSGTTETLKGAGPNHQGSRPDPYRDGCKAAIACREGASLE